MPPMLQIDDLTTSRREMTACALALLTQRPDCTVSCHSRRVACDMADNVGSLSARGKSSEKVAWPVTSFVFAVTADPAIIRFNPDPVRCDPPVAPERAPSGSHLTNSQQPQDYCMRFRSGWEGISNS